jgi:homoserine dehydrogenase
MKKLKIGIAGLGTVGRGTFKILTQKTSLLAKRSGAEIEVVAVSARDKSRDRGIQIPSQITWYEDAVKLASDANVEVVVELIGGADGVAYNLVKAALENKKHVVTANKALIAKHGFDLAKIAEKNNVALCFEASVAGGIPALKGIREGLAANKISKICGILNGTCNFIITKMKNENRSFDDVLKEAQALGYAEADPSFDVDGIDAAHKLAVISALAFGIKPNFASIYKEGITKITIDDLKFAEELGYNIRLLGIANETAEGKLEQRVHPCLISSEVPIGNVSGVLGAVLVNTDALGPVFFTGAGAGEMQTASAVVADLVDIAANRARNPWGIATDDMVEGQFVDISHHVGEYYLRFKAKDKDGVLSSITTILAQNGIGFEKVLQKLGSDKTANIILITHDVSESKVMESVDKISKMDYTAEAPVVIRVEAF